MRAYQVSIAFTEMRRTEKVTKEVAKQIGRRHVLTRTVEITTEPYITFTCGHAQREIDFDSRNGRKRPKRFTCWQCRADEHSPSL